MKETVNACTKWGASRKNRHVEDEFRRADIDQEAGNSSGFCRGMGYVYMCFYVGRENRWGKPRSDFYSLARLGCFQVVASDWIDVIMCMRTRHYTLWNDFTKRDRISEQCWRSPSTLWIESNETRYLHLYRFVQWLSKWDILTKASVPEKNYCSTHTSCKFTGTKNNLFILIIMIIMTITKIIIVYS